MTWNPEAEPRTQCWLSGKVIGLTPQLRGDERGQLAELMRHSESLHGIAQVYTVWIRRGASRANHYHILKHEWCSVIHGLCRLDLVDMDTGERASLQVGRGGDCMVVGLPPGVWHSFTQVGDVEPAIIVACASREYDPEHPDTIAAGGGGKMGHENG